MRPKRIIDITSRTQEDPQGATVSARVCHQINKDAAKTAFAKAMMALNEFSEIYDFGIVLIPHDRATKKPLVMSFKK